MLRSHFGQSFAYGFNQIKPSLSTFLLPKSGWEMILWEDYFGRRYRDLLTQQNTATKPDDIPVRELKDVKTGRSKFKSFPLPLVLFVCLFNKNVPQMSMKGPRELSVVITSLPQRGLAFRIFPFDLPLFLLYSTSWHITVSNFSVAGNTLGWHLQEERRKEILVSVNFC